ncbi:MAG: hypothetical protein P9D89_01970, partial [Candidatus Contendobacter sp.]|nr:hypothetical protein [Candidatus Contendobacter sp.]
MAVSAKSLQPPFGKGGRELGERGDLAQTTHLGLLSPSITYDNSPVASKPGRENCASRFKKQKNSLFQDYAPVFHCHQSNRLEILADRLAEH